VVSPQAVVDLSRAQFGITALFHFLFVPLTLGLSWLMVIMEAAYLKTNKPIYKEMVQFWGKLFAINFAMGVVTGVTLEFEFGQNWAYFSRFIGDAFGAALAIEGLTAFMLEATMFGLFFFSWNKLSQKKHFMVTLLLAVGANLSIVNILVANSWMQHPVATFFNFHTMHLHLTSFLGVYLSPLAQIRVGHVAFAGALTASFFVMGISAFYLLQGKHLEFAKRSFAAAAGFGLFAALSVALLGDANGLVMAKTEPAKMAATEAQWFTQKPPAAWYLFAIPDQKKRRNYAEIKIPYALSLIATHSLTKTVMGIEDIEKTNKERIKDGIIAYGALVKIRGGKNTPANEALFQKHKKNLGYALLLKRYAPNVVDATPAQIEKAKHDTIPYIFTVFFAFRVMLAAWGAMLLITLCAFFISLRKGIEKHRWILRATLYGIPLPWIAAEAGWVLAEVGRQPWTVHGIMPTFLSVSSLNAHTVAFSLAGFVIFYSLLLITELFLMFKYARKGPEPYGT
jgi:cytochrome d ubiquinol oxidase subunit I